MKRKTWMVVWSIFAVFDLVYFIIDLMAGKHLLAFVWIAWLLICAHEIYKTATQRRPQ